MMKIWIERIERFCSGKTVLVSVFLIALLLRFYRLGAHDLWYDEVFSTLYIDRPANSWAPYLFWTLLSFWAKIFGLSEFSLRFLPMAFSFLTTLVLFFLGKELFNRKTALFAACLIALSPFHLWYAQEARDYSLAVLIGTLSSYLLVVSLKRGNLKTWLAFILLSIAGRRTNYFYFFLFAAQFVFMFYFFRGQSRKLFWLLTLAAVFAVFSVTNVLLSKLAIFSKGALWIPPPRWGAIPIILQNYMLGYNGTFLLYVLASCGVLVAWVRLFWAAQTTRETRDAIAFCLFLFLIPVASIFVFSRLFFSIFLTRGMLLFSPYFYLLVAYGAMEWRGIVRTVLAGFLIAVLGGGVYYYYQDYLCPPFEYHIGTYIKKPVRPVVEYLRDHVGTGDKVAVTSESIRPGIVFYSKGEFQPYYLSAPRVMDTAMQKFFPNPTVHIPLDQMVRSDFKRLWIVFTDWWRAGRFDANSMLVEQWLKNRLKLVSCQPMEGLRICSYEKENRSGGSPGS